MAATPALRDPAAIRHPATFHRLAVAAVDRLTADSFAVTFDVPESLRAAFAFTQGQHVTIRWSPDASDVRRTYSLCAPPSAGLLRIGVKVIPGGLFSSYVAESLQAGDELDVMTPAGRFFTPLDPGASKHYASVVAGSGITPLLSIVAATLEVEPLSRFTLVYGNRTAETVMFLDELADLKDRYLTRLRLVHVLSRERQDSAVLSGRLDASQLDALFASVVAVPDVDEWFLCGPVGVSEAARACLRAAGVDERRIHEERFHADRLPAVPHADDDGGAPGDTGTRAAAVTFRLGGRTSHVRVDPAAESILDGVLRVRPDAPYACRSGVCGTCRARILTGEVREDRTHALDARDREAGFVLTCSAHPSAATVSIDYDA